MHMLYIFRQNIYLSFMCIVDTVTNTNHMFIENYILNFTQKNWWRELTPFFFQIL